MCSNLGIKLLRQYLKKCIDDIVTHPPPILSNLLPENVDMLSHLTVNDTRDFVPALRRPQVAPRNDRAIGGYNIKTQKRVMGHKYLHSTAVEKSYWAKAISASMLQAVFIDGFIDSLIGGFAGFNMSVYFMEAAKLSDYGESTDRIHKEKFVSVVRDVDLRDELHPDGARGFLLCTYIHAPR